MDQLPDFPDFDIQLDGAWLAPIQLAKDRDVPLWSDDVGLRMLARHLGVRTFGTPALFDQIMSERIEISADDHQIKSIAEHHRQHPAGSCQQPPEYDLDVSLCVIGDGYKDRHAAYSRD
ncbi:hypothetical protein [Fodinicola acaciae]|uniref:hypothetical protein n=1 Tax=Fodinicola acaciae TaxID=2681555 RepID=UPI0013D16968|nr:hypothetical protein [Fodinicola acaciae]